MSSGEHHEPVAPSTANDRTSTYVGAPTLADPVLRAPLMAATTSGEREADRLVGRTIGDCTILRLIGEGGMGRVYEGRQERPRRDVAVKLMRHGLGSSSAAKRFEFEAQVLARLRHPCIAQVYGAGTFDDDGEAVPYFVMEFIQGAKPITRYAEEKRLSVRERVALFARVCEAVAHGHQRGVIHRDLKPGNILVDAHGQPKIIDFGVARSTDSDLTVTTANTAVGQLVGTLQYMSPEQFASDPNDVDVRSDVYSLGVVFYELLAGHPPYDLRRAAISEAARIVCEQDPTRLSSISRTLRGDVELIALKCLEKNRTRRYASAAELAADVNAFVAGEPISAMAPGVIDGMRRFARRHRAMTAGLVGAFVVLVLAVAVVSFVAIEANRQRVRAEKGEEEARTQLARAQAVSGFVARMIASIDPDVARERDTTLLRMILDGAARDTESLWSQPEVQAEICSIVGGAYKSIGAYDAASPHLDRVVAIRRTLDGPSGARTLRAESDRALLLRAMGRLQDAEAPLREVYERSYGTYGPSHAETIGAMTNYGTLLHKLGRFEEADPLLHAALDETRRLHGPDDRDSLVALNNLANLLKDMGRAEEAEPLLRDAVERNRRVHGGDHSETLTALNNLGALLQETGRLDEAEPVLREVATTARRIFGAEHVLTLVADANVGFLLLQRGQSAAAADLFETSLAHARHALGSDHPHTLTTISNLALALKRLDRLDEAETLMREALARSRASLGNDHPETLRNLNSLGLLRQKRGDLVEAESLLREAYEGDRRVLGNDHPDTLTASHNLGKLLRSVESYGDAATVLAQSVEGHRRTFGDLHGDTLAEIELYIDVLVMSHRCDDASAVLMTLEQSAAEGLADEGTKTVVARCVARVRNGCPNDHRTAQR
ncbi:MAG: serine/threonine protein kinase [Phycisphaerae bacterium]|nr:serine/threonine protein kinase [Phycisphaerae bacterium]